MGTWGTGAFDNNTAADWSFEMAAAEDLSPVLQAIDRILKPHSELLEPWQEEDAEAWIDSVEELRWRVAE